MTSDQQQALNSLVSTQRHLGQSWVSYWQQYSSLSTWEFWVTFILLVGPLIVLYFFIDRRHAFRIGFYGFNVHVWFGYIDALGGTAGLWAYPFKVFPFFTLSVSLEAAFVPVVYMLVYQWSFNRQRNYYLYATITGAVLAFIIKPIMSGLDLFQVYRGMNYFYLFCGYVTIMLLSKWITDFFGYLHRQQGSSDGGIRVPDRKEYRLPFRRRGRSPM